MSCDSFLELNSNQLRVLRSASFDIWSILKPIFERQSNGVVRPYSSVADYKQKKELRFQRCSDYFCFKHDNVVIEVVLRRKIVYSVGVLGFQPQTNYPMLRKLFIKDDWLSTTEKDFSNGYQFYGRFSKNNFGQCIDLWLKIVIQYIFREYGIHWEDMYKQMEFIF